MRIFTFVNVEIDFDFCIDIFAYKVFYKLEIS